ncbi:M1 family aminopeptidase [Saccharothrix algeriensis]|uniref:Aminopeptidase n=1 Tax=Saccharothrix algeriensis TaxID=173560 RepID=A0A8T8I338_9PSEU|nr:M1 family aminopeptidase [Saccharothrix algeriensis]MBM7811474.1 aminopeptidase N [Saccharothrix algeriensis]QTR05313.1 aminopeptidase [Saccharothrix algeriensis]
MTISYDITWDLDPSAPTFRSRTSARFRGARPHADVEAVEVTRASHNGRAVPWDGERLALGAAEDNVLEVDAVFAYEPERGFRRVTADGDTYLYALHYPQWSKRSFCSLAQERGAFTVTVNAPGRVLVSSTEAPIVPYALAVAAGPWAEIGEHVHAVRTRAAEHARGQAVADLVKRSVACFEHLLGVPFPYRGCEVVFVPDIPILAFSSPGLIMFDDGALNALSTREPRYATTVVSHEVAHQWAGNLVDAEPWLVEGLATYLSRLATEELLPGSRPWSEPDAAPLPDRPYAAHLARIAAVEEAIGRTALLDGLGRYFRRFAHTTASWAHLRSCWRR